MATQADVRRLYVKLVEVLGEDAAETLMELLRTGYDHHGDPQDADGGLRDSDGAGSP